MTMADSLRVLAAMARETVPSVIDIALGRLERATVDERARRFGDRVVELLDVELTIERSPKVVPDRAYVYMSNHQSHLDIPILYKALAAQTLRMVAKAELFRIPVWGPGLRQAEFIEIDRGDHDQARVAIDRAAALVREGVSIWIAPEGSRSRDGRVGPLKKGGFHLAMGTGAPIVPVALRGTIDILPRGARSMQRGARVDVTIGDPIEVEGRALADLMSQVGAFLHRHVEVN